MHSLQAVLLNMYNGTNYLAPGGGCEVLFSPGLSVYLSVCVCICVSGQYFDILFLGFWKRYRSEIDTGYLYGTLVTGTVHCFLKVQSYHKN